MPAEQLSLSNIERLATSVAVALPVFDRPSEIPWQRSSVVHRDLDVALDLARVVAASCAASSRRHPDSGDSLCIGVTAAGAPAQAVPVVFDSLPAGTTWRAWIAHVATEYAFARERFHGISVDDLEFLLGRPRGSGRRTLFSVLVDGSHRAEDGRPLVNDLTLRIDAGGLAAVYDERMYERPVVESWLDDVVALLRATDADIALEVMVAAEMHRSQTAVVLTDTDGVDEAPDLVDRFAATVATYADSTALTDQQGAVSYEELHALVCSVSTSLREAGVVATDIVGLLAYPGRRFIAGLLGILHSGAAPLVLDLQSPTSRLRDGLANSAVRKILTDSEAGPAAHAAAASLEDVTVIAVEKRSSCDTSSQLAAVHVEPTEPGYVLLTSGSTGSPKAVLQTRRTLNSIIDWQIERTGREIRPRTLQRSALSFDVALQEILSTVCSGGCLEILPAAHHGDFAAVARFIQERRIERLFIPPSGLHALLAVAETNQLASLCEVVCAGEPLTVSSTLRMVFRSIGARLDNQYGPTETHVCLASWVEGDPFTWPDRPPIGYALPETTTSVVDADHRVLPVGATGELVVAGRTVALGYLGEPSDGFADGEQPGSTTRRYSTGDLVRLHPDRGFLFVGRADDQVKIRGYRIELGDVEAGAVATGLVRAAACSVRRSAGVDRLLLAAVTAQPISKERLLEAMSTRLPSYMVPRPAEVAFVDALPMTRSGKVDRDQVGADLSEQMDVDLDRHNDAEMLRTLWLRCLGIHDCEETDSFVGLGGDSLAAVELAASLDDVAGMKVPLRAILDGMTLVDLQAIDGDPTAVTNQDGPIPQVDKSDREVLTTQTLPSFGEVWCVSPAEARHLYLDVVVCSTYRQLESFREPLRTVVDVGANIGLFSLDVLHRNPTASIIAVEPHPQLAEALRRNVGDRGTVIEAAAGQRPGRGNLSIYRSMPALSSLEPDVPYERELMEQLLVNEAVRSGTTSSRAALRHHVDATTQVDTTDVEVVRLADVFDAASVDRVSLLKIDVQHGEQAVLAGVDDLWWPLIEKVVVEVQDTAGGVAATAALLRSKDYVVEVRQNAVLHDGTDVHYLFAERG